MGNFDGHSKITHDNVYTFPNVYGPSCFWHWPTWFPVAGAEEHFMNNTCYLTTNENYIKMPGDCSLDNSSSIGVRVGRNRVFAPGKNATVNGCQDTVSIQQWFKDVGDFDAGTTVEELPSIDEIVKHGLSVVMG